MIDTCNFFIDSMAMGTGNTFSIANYLDFVEPRKDPKTQLEYLEGWKKNYRFKVYQNGVKCSGSLAKFYFGENISTLTRAATQQALEMMGDLLHIDVMAGKLRRVDIGAVIPTSHTPANYFQFLGEKPRFYRLPSKTTLYYQTKQRVISLYDKQVEAAKNKMIIPPALEGRNLLRIELRYLTNIKKQLKQADPVTAILYEPNFYCWLVNQWKEEFLSIKKINATMINEMIKQIKKPSDCPKVALADLLVRYAGQEYIDNFMNLLKEEHKFDRPADYTRAKKGLQDCLLQPASQQKNEYIEELETAVKNVAKYAR